MKKILAAALVLGLVIPTASQAANTPKKPMVKAAAGAEGTATHETAEVKTGTAEKTKKVSKAKTSIIKKKGTPKAKK